MMQNKKFEGICEYCGNPTYAHYKSLLKRFCSHKCSNQWKWENVRKRKEYITFLCPNCGKEVKVDAADSRIKKGQKNFFCSKACCANDYHLRKQKTCPICGAKHSNKGQSCGIECGKKLAKWKIQERKHNVKFNSYKEYLLHEEELFKIKKKRVRKPLTEKQRKEMNKRRREKNKERRKNPKYREYMRCYLKQYNENHKKERNSRQQERLQKDPIFKLKTQVRKMIYQSFIRRDKYKSKPTEEILGCSLDFFINYLKSLFKEGMTLDNYGKWQIDHIIPLSTAEKEEDVIRLCHYTNLQPLWDYENRQKSNKII